MMAATPSFAHLVRHLHDLGPRPVGELLGEIADKFDVPDADVLAVLERYARLSPTTVAALGATDFPPSPIRLVG